LTQDLRAQRDVSYEVLFADNSSTDGTLETLANLWPGRTQANSSILGYHEDGDGEPPEHEPCRFGSAP